MIASNDLTVQAVRLGMDMATRRVELASHNVAYANVPGSKAERGNFDQAIGLLQRVAAHDDVRPEALASADLSQMATDANKSVSLDDEVSDMAMASAHYQALSEVLNRHFGLMSLALSGDQG
ncbi:hypothetical protein [Pinirhizobacter sp.]|jgi:flagellar basal body rod protein FlgB|uniref:hypothetical protein n=1 Tax=Pinirhizobacter sp. TaxID=2950432 RepID=UPI002F41E89C